MVNISTLCQTPSAVVETAKTVVWILKTIPTDKDTSRHLRSSDRSNSLFKAAKYAVAAAYFRHLDEQVPRRFLDYPLDLSLPTYKTGILPSPSEIALEGPQVLSTSEDVDGISFALSNMEGTVLTVSINKRDGGLAEVLVFLTLNDHSLYSLPLIPDTITHVTDQNNYTAGGILIECMEPMRKWRIAYNGLLRNGDNDYQHVKFSVIWSPLYNGVDYLVDLPMEIKAKAVAASGLGHLTNLDLLLRDSNMNRYDQWGVAMGSLTIGDNAEKKLLLRGARTRRLGQLNWKKIIVQAELNCYMENGDGLQLGLITHENGLQHFCYGFLAAANGCSYPVVDSNLPSHLDDRDYNYVTFRVQGRDREVKLRHLGKMQYFAGVNYDSDVFVMHIKAEMDGKIGYGQYITAKRPIRNLARPSRVHLEMLMKRPGLPNGAIPIALPFTESACRLSSIVGGKGASLAQLGTISNYEFTVPRGFCLTTTAYSEQLKRFPELQLVITRLDSVLRGLVAGDPQQECDRVVEVFDNLEVLPAIKEEIRKQMEAVFPRADIEQVKVAVRSSGVGEDGSELSFAGQHSTYLGVFGIEQIARCVAKCWGSQFSFPAVAYKRTNGLDIKSQMAVVIMELIESEVSGVMFTRDPSTGNPQTMTITCNYGLGESVVAGSANVDTVILHRTWNNEVSVKETFIGLKERQTRLLGNGTTELVATSEELTNRMCIPNRLAVKLGEIGILLEQSFGDPRDVEWSYWEGRIYIVQARPITALYEETEEEVIHEFDNGLITDHEIATIANVGEVLPGPITPLSYTTTNKILCFSVQRQRYDGTFRPYCDPYVLTMFRHLSFNLIYHLGVLDPVRTTLFKEMIQISFFGRLLNEMDFLCKRAYERYPNSPSRLTVARVYYYMMKGVLHFWWNAKKAANHPFTPKLNYQSPATPEALYQEIQMRMAEDLSKALDGHISCSGASLQLTGLVFRILKSTPGCSPDVYTDLSQLLSTSKYVESASVPKDIKDVAILVSKDSQGVQFTQMPVNEAIKWLENHKGEVGATYAAFMEKHGHRCPGEFDVHSKTWQEDPSPIVVNIQGEAHDLIFPKPAAGNQEQKASGDLSLQNKLDWYTSLLMEILLRPCRTIIASREMHKSIVIKYTDVVRQAYRRLASMLVSQGKMDEPELLYYMTNWEIQRLVYDEVRNPKILMRARSRRSTNGRLHETILPEITYDFSSLGTQTVFQTDGVITGTPVYRGCVKGIARVVLTCKEAQHLIQNGDILITRSTDIGWSPYFNRLSGIVTEIGGLISHGAVVAREVKLPCIVGAANATNVFKSGEEIILHATSGWVGRVSPLLPQSVEGGSNYPPSAGNPDIQDRDNQGPDHRAAAPDAAPVGDPNNEQNLEDSENQQLNDGPGENQVPENPIDAVVAIPPPQQDEPVVPADKVNADGQANAHVDYAADISAAIVKDSLIQAVGGMHREFADPVQDQERHEEPPPNYEQMEQMIEEKSLPPADVRRFREGQAQAASDKKFMAGGKVAAENIDYHE